jgi:putative transposase
MAFNTEKLYSVQESAEIIDKTERWVRELCKSGKLEAITVIDNGGEQYRISQAALVEFGRKKNVQLNFPNDEPRNASLPLVPEQSGCSLPSAQGFSLIDLNSKRIDKEAVPTKAKDIALARQDVLNTWEEFRNKAEKKTLADADFISLFNSGIYCPELYKKVGAISKGTLYRWKKDFDEVGNYTALIPQYNYRSSFEKETKLTAVEKKYFLDLLLQPNKVSVGNATRLVKYVLSKQGFNNMASAPTYRRFADWFKTVHYDVWTLMREGQKALIEKVAPYVERDAGLLNVGDVLVADGHVLDFQVVNPFSGKPCRAILVGYIDWKSTDVAGYEIMLTENTQNIASALRNAVINLGKIPKVCYQDNGRAFRARFFNASPALDECGFRGLFGKLGIVPVFAQPYNAKAKIAERFFREFSETCEKLLPSYVGNSPVNKPAYMMRNEKFHKSIHNNFVPTIEQAKGLIEAWLEFHRSQPCPNAPDKTIGEVFMEGCGEGVDVDLLDDLMMASESRKIGRNGIKFLNNHYFSESLYGINDKVEIRYSLFDLSYVKVYTEHGDYLGKAETVLQIHPMAAVLGNQTDVYSLKKAIRDTKKFQKDTIKKAKQLLPHLDKPLDWQAIF